MAWIQIKLKVDAALAERLSDAFSDQGAVSVTFEDAEDQPIFEPELGTTPIWQNTQVTALFDAETEAQKVIYGVKGQLKAVQDADFKVEALEDKDWIREWMDQFHPMQFGNRLWIVPSWHQAPDANGVNLLLDPGLAFGPGTHPTTAMCLRWLDANPPSGKQVIDYGCGSGILALAAAKLGASQVTGTDIDPQAIQASQQNAANNTVQIPFALVKDFASPAVDLLLANILSGPLKALAPEFSRLVKSGGQLVLSGLLESQAAELQTHYRQFGFVLDQLETQEEWARLSGYKID